MAYFSFLILCRSGRASAIVAAILFASGCMDSKPQFVIPDYLRWSEVQPGMSEHQVNALLGPPLKSGFGKSEGTVYFSMYGIVQFRSRQLCAPYEFAIEFDSKSRTVKSKYDPFGGDLSSNGIPAQPRLILPVEGQKFDHYPRFVDFRWQPVSGNYPIDYEVQLKSDWYDSKSWDSPGVRTKIVPEPYLCVAWVGMNHGVWRVRARNRDGIGRWSEERTFDFLQ